MIACDATISAMLHDDDGGVLNAGRRTRKPPARARPHRARHDYQDGQRLLLLPGEVSAVPDLQELAERDERILISGTHDDLVWQDEILQDQLRAGITALRAPQQP